MSTKFTGLNLAQVRNTDNYCGMEGVVSYHMYVSYIKKLYVVSHGILCHRSNFPNDNSYEYVYKTCRG